MIAIPSNPIQADYWTVLRALEGKRPYDKEVDQALGRLYTGAVDAAKVYNPGGDGR